jgi:hypothetical protein
MPGRGYVLGPVLSAFVDWFANDPPRGFQRVTLSQLTGRRRSTYWATSLNEVVRQDVKPLECIQSTACAFEGWNMGGELFGESRNCLGPHSKITVHHQCNTDTQVVTQTRWFGM